MITTMDQAVRIQKARHAAGKIGFAKAVQRYIKRYGVEGTNNLANAFKAFPAPVNRRVATLADSVDPEVFALAET